LQWLIVSLWDNYSEFNTQVNPKENP